MALDVAPDGASGVEVLVGFEELLELDAALVLAGAAAVQWLERDSTRERDAALMST